MYNFKIGQKVVCINGENWHRQAPNIKTGEVVTISGFSKRKKYLTFEEKYYLDIEGEMISYYPEYFKPLVYDSATKELIKKFKLVEEKSDIEIKELEYFNN